MNPLTYPTILRWLPCLATLCVVFLAGCNTQVPTVLDLPLEDAEIVLVNAGLSVGTVTEAHSEMVEEGHVISQSPAGATAAPQGSAVDLVLSLGVEPVSVPSVVGVFEVNATTILENADLTVGSVVKQYSKVMPAGNVLTQSPEADTQVPPGTAVDLVLSLGSDGINISSISQLQLIGLVPNYPLDGNYVLVNDIDATMTEDWKSAGGFMPIGNFNTPFEGSFDGQDFVLSNLYIYYPQVDRIGVFGMTSEMAVVQNLVLENVMIRGLDYVGGLAGSNLGIISGCHVEGVIRGRIYSGGVVGYNTGTITDTSATTTLRGFINVGGIAGHVSSTGSIEFCRSAGTVESDSDYAGGVVGLNGGAILHCYTSAEVFGNSFVGGLAGLSMSDGSSVIQSYATGAVEGLESVGGAVGFMAFDSFLTQCYGTGPVTGEEAVGGLVGINYGEVTECYSTGAVEGDTETGGLVGDGGAAVVDSFWDAQTSGMNTSAGGVGAQGQTTNEMMQMTTFTNAGWDFEEVWYMLDEGSYPYLQALPAPVP